MAKGVPGSYKKASMGISNFLRILVQNNFMVFEEYSR